MNKVHSMQTECDGGLAKLHNQIIPTEWSLLPWDFDKIDHWKKSRTATKCVKSSGTMAWKEDAF